MLRPFLSGVLILLLFYLFLNPPFLKTSPKSYWITGITLWDGVSQNPYKASIHVVKDRFHSILKGPPPEDIKIPVIRFENLYAIPGLINTHVHILNTSGCAPGYGFTPSVILQTLNAFLKSGITTVADMGGWPHLLKKLKSWSQKNLKLGPEIMIAGPMITRMGGYPDYWMPSVARKIGVLRFLEVEKGADFFDDLKKMGVNYIKVALQEKTFTDREIPMVGMDELTGLTVTAQEKGLPVFAHALTVKGYQQGLQGGIDAFVHAPHEIIGKEIRETLVKKQIPIVPTIWVWKSPWALPDDPSEKLESFSEGVSNKIRKQWQKYLLDYQQSDAFPSYLTGEEGIKKETAKEGYKNLVENLKNLKKEGALFAFGTDAPYCFDTASSSFKEMEELKEIGFFNMDILKMATTGSARLLKREKEIGTVEPGKKADMVLLKGNPFDDLSALKNPYLVIRQGEFIDPKAKIPLRDKIQVLWIFSVSLIQSLL